MKWSKQYIGQKFLNHARKAVLWTYRKRLKNHDFCLISNNCIGSIICHDLGEQFRTPCITVGFTNEDFLTFCEHLPYYLSLPVEEITKDEPFPVGNLHGEFGDVRLEFQHYNNDYQLALRKWHERCKRVDIEQVYIVFEAREIDDAMFDRYQRLPFKHKMIYTCNRQGENVCDMGEFYTNGFEMGKILKYPNRGLHRYLEKFDYVRFFNDLSK